MANDHECGEHCEHHQEECEMVDELCRQLIASVRGDPRMDGRRIMIMIDDDEHGGMLTGGYEDARDVLTDLFCHARAFAREALGADILYGSIGDKLPPDNPWVRPEG